MQMPLRAFLMLLPVLGSGPSGGTHVAWYPSLGGVRIPRGYPEDSPWTWLLWMSLRRTLELMGGQNLRGTPLARCSRREVTVKSH